MNIQTRRKVRDHNAPTMGKSVQAMARKGRAGDTEAGHLTKGEVVVPKRVWEADPGLQQRAMSAMMQAGLNPAQYIVGHPANSRNPQTGAREFADLAYVNGQWVNSGTGQAADFSQDQNSFANSGTYSSQPQAAPRPGNAMSAPAPQDTRDWGADASANQELARITGYQGDFGTGGFSTYMQGANDVQKMNAAQYLTDQGRGQRIDWNTGMVAPVDDGAANNYGSPTGPKTYNFGQPDTYTPTGQENPNNRAANQELAGLGYTGEFGGGGFNQWIGSQSADIQQQAANILARNNQPERIQDWGGNGFLNESPYINGTVPVGYTTPPAPPASGPTQPLGQGFNTFDFGTGQDQIKNFKSYYDQYGQVPVASGFTPENNQSFGIYDPRPDFGGAWDDTYSMIANLSPEDFAGLARSIGVNPNDRDAWLAIENAFGQRTMTYGDLVRDANGNYSWSNPQGSEVASALERGYMRIGSGPNSIEVPIADLISGKYSVNAVDLALSGGYDPNGMEGSTNTLDAARQIMQEIPGLANTRWNSAEYNTIRKPIEAATPGFNQQVGNRIARQAADGRSIPGGNTVGPTNLSSVISGANLGGYTTPGGTTVPGTGAPSNTNASATPSGQSILDYSNNAAGWDRGSQLITMGSGGNFSMWRHPDGTIYHSDANGEWVLEPVGNGLYRDTLYGVLRNSGGIVVNPDGSPVVTDYSRQNHPGGTASIGRLYGSSGERQMLGSFAGVDLTTLRDGNNTPIRGNYGGGRPPASGGVSTAPIPLPSPGGGTGGGGTGGGGGGGTTVPTSTGTGLTPGTTNPYSLPYGINLNIFGQGQQSTGTNTQAATQQQYDPYSWLSLLNLGYGSSTYGQPTYTSADPNQAGGINYVQPNSQNVEFRTPFAYS